jgi:hypothetical protein
MSCVYVRLDGLPGAPFFDFILRTNRKVGEAGPGTIEKKK